MMKTLIACVAVAFMLLFNFLPAFRTLFGRQVLKEFNAALDHVYHPPFYLYFQKSYLFSLYYNRLYLSTYVL